jgi:hypothetical protein
MPHLVQMDKKLSKKGLVIIAPEVQGSSNEDIKEVLEENKAEYTVTKGVTGPRLIQGIPSSVVFDVSGKLAYIGHPSDPNTEKTIKSLLKNATPDEDSDSASSGLTARKPDLVANRKWTNAEGKEMEAALVDLTGTTGHFKFANGQKFDYDISKLSEADQAAIKAASEAAAPKAE